MKTKLYVLYGGKSVEHEVSLKTAYTVMLSIDESKYDLFPIYITREGIWSTPDKLSRSKLELSDLIAVPRHAEAAESIGQSLISQFALPGRKVVLPLLHGSNGEDGTIQGMMELLNIPYVGNGVLSSAVTLDKAISKQLLAQAGINQAKYLAYRYDQWAEDRAFILEEAEMKLGYPCYVKPASLGSSIGISRCSDKQQLTAGIAEAFKYDSKLVLESEVLGREIQVAVMGNEKPLASLPGEFIHKHLFFDFESKYMDKHLTMSIPAQLSEELTGRIRKIAIQAYQVHGCSGLARVDCFLDHEGHLYVNEINALPGFTNYSMYPVMWERTDGTLYSELVEKLIDYAFTRHAEKQTIHYTR
ncbi:D-alanine--D-alanine ligase family protein [Candidatus Pristimantibacillus sp. PTI5]|uniref:D-alanine--D-alanine ligase family protein n=1 Tax=Candidatus Pristimantibacillus sp. PTI5 TaxID=3400422 RepID=UPI003B028AF2